jgi:hypothetical protein
MSSELCAEQIRQERIKSLTHQFLKYAGHTSSTDFPTTAVVSVAIAEEEENDWNPSEALPLCPPPLPL